MAAFSTIAAVGLGAAGLGAQVVGQNKATKAAKEASTATDATQRYIYDDTVKRNAYRTQTGNQALSQLAGMYGLEALGGGQVPLNTQGSFGGFGNFGYGNNGFLEPEFARSGGYGGGGFGNLGNQGNYRGAQQYQQERNPDGSRIMPNKIAGLGGGQGFVNGVQQGATPSPFQSFYDSPDYQLAFTEGQDAIEGGAAARGGLLSGNTAKAVIGHGQNLANTTFGNYRNTLTNIAGLGQQADQSTTQAGQQYGAQFGNNQAALAAQRGQSATNIGNTIGGLAGFGVGAIGQKQGWL